MSLNRPPVLTLTEAAISRIKMLMQKAPAETLGLKIGVRARGCSGLSYTVDYASKVNPLDEVVKDKDVTVFVDSSAVMFLIGSEMDYAEDKFQKGFVFRNPNEKGRCGCGESFQVEPLDRSAASSHT